MRLAHIIADYGKHMANSIINRIKNEPTPLIDGEQVTFVWQGKAAPKLVGDFTGWDDGKPVKLDKAGKGVWTYQLTLPSDAYIEYGFVDGDESLDDPSNPRHTPNGVGGYNNFFKMPGYHPSPLAEHTDNIPHGSIHQVNLSTGYYLSGKKRTVHFYQPPVSEPVPLVVVWDGQDYLQRAGLNDIVDNLIAGGRIRPIALAMVNHTGEKSRSIEYSCNEATLGWVMQELLHLAKRELNLLDVKAHPGEFGVIGSSMGGLMALYTGARVPYIFGKVLSQSGAFAFGRFELVVFDLLRHGPVRPIKIWQDAGLYDLPGLLDVNRRMHSMLTERGYQAGFHEYHAGHNFPAWRDDVSKGLEALFGAGK